VFDVRSRWFSCNFANHWPDFLYRGTTVDFGDVCLPGVSFKRYNHTPGLGPDDSVIFNILLSRVLLHPFQSFISGFSCWFAVFVAPDGIMLFSIWFVFGDAIICYFDENVRKFLNRILCTADTVSAEFQSCLMWESRPVSLRQLPSRFRKRWWRYICSDNYWIVVTTV